MSSAKLGRDANPSLFRAERLRYLYYSNGHLRKLRNALCMFLEKLSLFSIRIVLIVCVCISTVCNTESVVCSTSAIVRITVTY